MASGQESNDDKLGYLFDVLYKKLYDACRIASMRRL